jgi:hypothetical protein
VLKAFQDRLEAAGKLPKVVTLALMLKMITIFNPMVRDDLASARNPAALPGWQSQFDIFWSGPTYEGSES